MTVNDNYNLNDRTRNDGAKLIVEHFNTSVAPHFYPIKITTTWNALPNEVVSSRTVNSFKNSLTNTGQKLTKIPKLTGSDHRCRPCTIQVCTNNPRLAIICK